jgi:hypothetical protein
VLGKHNRELLARSWKHPRFDSIETARDPSLAKAEFALDQNVESDEVDLSASAWLTAASTTATGIHVNLPWRPRPNGISLRFVGHFSSSEAILSPSSEAILSRGAL